MPKNRGSVELAGLVRVGAEARLAQLEAERRAILEMFPDLRRRGRPASRGRAGARRGTRRRKAAGRPSRRAPTMSADARKAASERMKKYWADRRKAKAAEPVTGGE